MIWINSSPFIRSGLILLCLTTLSLSASADDLFENKVNLALRQTAHQLLLANGDSTMTIAPVQYVGDLEYMLPMEGGFDYDLLPSILLNALEENDIHETYRVLIQNCEDGEVILGYIERRLENEELTCRGRDQTTDCANILIRFDESIPAQGSTPAQEGRSSLLAWLFLPFLAGIGVILYQRSTTRGEEEQSRTLLALGQYSFDPKNQDLFNGEEKRTLTYRENKLLHFFADRPNEVLTREEIQSAVWEDEGIVVGRSLDVFISRLRKMLKQDPSVQIKNVHGVGYRLELP